MKKKNIGRKLVLFFFAGCNGTRDIECQYSGTMTCLRNARCNALKQCDAAEDEEGCTERKSVTEMLSMGSKSCLVKIILPIWRKFCLITLLDQIS